MPVQASVSVIDVQGNAVTLPSGVVASYATCGGTTIHVIRQPIVPPDFPSVNATSVPGLQVSNMEQFDAVECNSGNTLVMSRASKEIGSWSTLKRVSSVSSIALGLLTAAIPFTPFAGFLLEEYLERWVSAARPSLC
ncbi:hypothetical protein F751_0497 [Auxenochlorella protothecoides]|uniref:Uncharacterized protein n=1 Tax=Auxenochlorella protothecoides TaxID=3075 RepID=A0A087SIB6_AUXPR|nr:hypothetical protein F751_0497 [Auxenochlorella protothecoides]KFM25470.1 hypothetical protein F751_0497 [Auxenochlorella protothecoides]